MLRAGELDAVDVEISFERVCAGVTGVRLELCQRELDGKPFVLLSAEEANALAQSLRENAIRAALI